MYKRVQVRQKERRWQVMKPAQAEQKIAPSPALKAVCSHLNQTADNKLRRYDHTSPATADANTSLILLEK